jgi:BASS family bile acid:Na+ symporter
MANVYTHLGRANVALSVTLTAVSCLAAVLTTPLALTALAAQFGESARFPVPLAALAGQLLLLLVLPVLAGMVIRRRPENTRRHGRALLGLSVAAVAALLGLTRGPPREHQANRAAAISRHVAPCCPHDSSTGEVIDGQ